MVGNEGFGRGSPCNHVHEWRLHLQEAQAVQKPPDVGDDLGSGDELVPHTLVDDEVQVSLPEPGLLVLQPVVEVWEHVQAGGQEGDGARDDAQLSLLGFAWEGAVATSMQLRAATISNHLEHQSECQTWVSCHSDHVTSSQPPVDFLKVLLRVSVGGHTYSNRATPTQLWALPSYLASAITWILSPSPLRS